MNFQILIIFLNFFFGIFGIYRQSGLRKYFLNPVNSFWVVFIYFSVIQPLSNLSEYNARFGHDNVSLALLAFFISAVFLYIGNRLSLGSKIARYLPTMHAASESRLGLIALLLLALGISLTLALVEAYGGWGAYFQRTNLRLLEVDVSDYLTTGPRIATFAVLIGLSNAVYRHAQLAASGFCLVGLGLFFWFIYHGSRSSTILVAIVVFGAFYVPRMRTPNIVAAFVFLIAMALIVGFIGAYRNVFSEFGQYTQGLTLAELAQNSLGFMLRSDTTGFSSVSINEDFGMAAAAVRYVPLQVPYEYGYSNLQILTQWIPRSIWSNKIYPSGEVWDAFNRAAHTSNYINSAGFAAGPAPTIVGKYYYAFGLPGVVIGSLLSGIMLKVFWAYALRLPSNVRAIFIIAIAPIGYMEANNPTLWITFWLPSAGISLAIVLLVARVSRKMART